MLKHILIACCLSILGTYLMGQSYQIGAIPFNYDSITGGQTIPLAIEDGWSDGVALPFSFCLHDSLFDSLWIGSNGQITFTRCVPGSYCTFPWPTSLVPDNTVPPYTILSPWHDLSPNFGGTVKVRVWGFAPYRRVTISFINVRMFQCNDYINQQVKLFETTNVVEMHIMRKPLCTSWNNGAAAQGIQINNNLAYVLPGFNVPTPWAVIQDAQAYVPIGPCSGPSPNYSVQGKVYADVDANCAFDSLIDYRIASRAILADGGQTYTWTNAQGEYWMTLPPGNHTISEYIPQPYFASSCLPGAQHQILANGNPIYGLDFADSANYTCSDLQVGISSPGIHRCDTSDLIVVSYANLGMSPDSNVVVTIQLHDSIQPFSASMPYTLIGPNTYAFALGTLNPSASGNINIWVALGCAPPMTIYCLDAWIQGLASVDCNETNNFDQSCLPLNAPFDPNSKSVTTSRSATLGYFADNTIEATDTLMYRVDFQNVGTSMAHKVEIHDDLDTNFLDIRSLEIISSSHAFGYWVNGNRLIVRFDSIYLPDSTTDEPNSHGFFRFRIRQKTGNPPGTVITNQAQIYFDFEPAVLTNVTHSTIPVLATLPTAMDGGMHVRPNPGSERMVVSFDRDGEGECHLLDVTGKLISRQPFASGECAIQTAHLPNGLYFYAAYSEGKCIGVGKWVKQ